MSRDTKQSAQLIVKSVNADGEKPIGVVGDEKWVRVISTSHTFDRDGESIDTKSLHIPIKPKGWKYASDMLPTDIPDIPSLTDHKMYDGVEKQVGSVRSLFINENGELESVIGLTSLQRGVDIHTLAKEGHLGNSISGTFIPTKQSYVSEDNIYYDMELGEVSFVFKGANQDAILLAVSKQAKGEKMENSKTLEEKKADLEKLQKEIEAEEAKTTETVEKLEETPEKTEVETTTTTETTEKANVAQSVEDETAEEEAETETSEKTEEVKTEVETNTNENKENETMEKTIVPKQVKEPLEVKDEVATKGYSSKEIRENFVDQFKAKFVDGDKKKFAEVRSKAFEMAGVKSKDVLGAGTNAASLFLPTLVAQDIIKCYNSYAGYAAGVSKMDITGQTLIDLPVKGASQLFSRVGRGQKKPLNDTPVSTVRVEPREWATIFAWFDYVQKNSKLAVYNMIVDAMAESYALTEDHIVLKYAGGTVVGEATADNASGLVPLLTTAARTVTAADNTGAGIIAALATALGAIKGQGNIEVGTNRATWMRVVTATNGMGNFIANADGTVTLGGAGTVSPVFTDALADGELVVGIRRNYEYVTNGGISTLFSQEAYLEDALGSGTDLNLFQQDASGLRGEFWADGTARCLDSFYLVNLAAQE